MIQFHGLSLIVGHMLDTVLTLSMPNKIFSRQHSNFFSFFRENLSYHIICIVCLAGLFSLKNEKYI